MFVIGDLCNQLKRPRGTAFHNYELNLPTCSAGIPWCWNSRDQPRENLETFLESGFLLDKVQDELIGQADEDPGQLVVAALGAAFDDP